MNCQNWSGYYFRRHHESGRLCAWISRGRGILYITRLAYILVYCRLVPEISSGRRRQTWLKWVWSSHGMGSPSSVWLSARSWASSNTLHKVLICLTLDLMYSTCSTKFSHSLLSFLIIFYLIIFELAPLIIPFVLLIRTILTLIIWQKKCIQIGKMSANSVDMDTCTRPKRGGRE